VQAGEIPELTDAMRAAANFFTRPVAGGSAPANRVEEIRGWFVKIMQHNEQKNGCFGAAVRHFAGLVHAGGSSETMAGRLQQARAAGDWARVKTVLMLLERQGPLPMVAESTKRDFLDKQNEVDAALGKTLMTALNQAGHALLPGTAPEPPAARSWPELDGPEPQVLQSLKSIFLAKDYEHRLDMVRSTRCLVSLTQWYKGGQ
jgi:hypothetical protein